MDTWPAETCLPKCPVSNRIVVLATLTWDERVRVGVFDSRFLTIYDPALRIYIHILTCLKSFNMLMTPILMAASVVHLLGILKKFPVEEHEVLSSIYGPDFEVGTRSSWKKNARDKVKDWDYMGGWLVLPGLGSLKFPFKASFFLWSLWMQLTCWHHMFFSRKRS